MDTEIYFRGCSSSSEDSETKPLPALAHGRSTPRSDGVARLGALAELRMCGFIRLHPRSKAYQKYVRIYRNRVEHVPVYTQT